MSKFKKLVSQPLFLPIFCMILVMAVNIIYDVMAVQSVNHWSFKERKYEREK